MFLKFSRNSLPSRNNLDNLYGLNSNKVTKRVKLCRRETPLIIFGLYVHSHDKEAWLYPNIYADRYIVFVFLFRTCMYVHSFVHHIRGIYWYVTVLHQKFLKWDISRQPLTFGPWEGLLSCHEFWPQVSCPGVGLEVKI